MTLQLIHYRLRSHKEATCTFVQQGYTDAQAHEIALRSAVTPPRQRGVVTSRFVFGGRDEARREAACLTDLRISTSRPPPYAREIAAGGHSVSIRSTAMPTPSRRVTAGCLALTNSPWGEADNGKVVRIEYRSPTGDIVIDGLLWEGEEDEGPSWVIRSLGTPFACRDEGPCMRAVYLQTSLIPLGKEGDCKTADAGKRKPRKEAA